MDEKLNMLAKGDATWTSVEFEISSEHEDLAGWVMVQCGATGCEVKSRPDGTLFVIAIFDEETLSNQQIEHITNELTTFGILSRTSGIKTRTIVQEDWLEKWKEGFKPFAIGDRLVVSPPWEKENATAILGDRKLLLVEPGLAFGTGLHATTQYCLRNIELLNGGTRVIDVGTGSGILAIATAMLHPNYEITAIDNDPNTIDVAKENLQLNAMEGKIKLMAGSMDDLSGEMFDFILSNLTCEVIVSLLPQYRAQINKGGRVICAGVLNEKQALLEDAAAQNGFAVISKDVSDPWCGSTLEPI